jgi:hypothetical protein
MSKSRGLATPALYLAMDFVQIRYERLPHVRFATYWSITKCIFLVHVGVRRRLSYYGVENGVTREIFWPKKEEVTRNWRQLHNWELHDLYSSPNIIRVISSRRMRWAGHVARSSGRREIYTGFRWGDVKEIDNLEGPGINGGLYWNES